MDDSFGIESPPNHHKLAHRPPARYLVIIDEAGMTVARVFLASLEQVAEVDAGSEEVALMTRGLVPVRGALGSEWDRALQGHSTAERAAADIYTVGP
jgi:hypothetical protein